MYAALSLVWCPAACLTFVPQFGIYGRERDNEQGHVVCQSKRSSPYRHVFIRDKLIFFQVWTGRNSLIMRQASEGSCYWWTVLRKLEKLNLFSECDPSSVQLNQFVFVESSNTAVEEYQFHNVESTCCEHMTCRPWFRIPFVKTKFSSRTRGFE